MPDTCSRCRFWRHEPSLKQAGEEPTESFGWCRRHPPRIVDQMARMAFAAPVFGPKVPDPAAVANVHAVEEATLFPATFADAWCGEFEDPLPVVPLC